MKNRHIKISSFIIIFTLLFQQIKILNINGEVYGYKYIQNNNKNKNEEILFREDSQLPLQYDLRKYGYVSTVKNQGGIGACWAFATLGSLESCALKKGKKYDFSEIHMAANNDVFSVDIGGNNRISASYLTSWKGPVLETDDPYPNPPEKNNVKSNKYAKPAFHVQDVIFLPPRKDSLDNKYIKNALMNYGATTASINYNIKYLNASNASFYNYDVNKVNHAILIVGWDDKYSKENFLQKPPGDGAFICKNSYGTNFGKEGYFYISYYDKTIGNDNAVFHNLESTDNYDYIYSSKETYDCDDKSFNFHMEVFEPINNSKEELSAISFFSHKRNQKYGIYIEPDYDKNTFNGYCSGKLKKIKTVTYEEGGFHTVKLDTKIGLLDGKRFALIVSNEGSSEKRIFGSKTQVKPVAKYEDMEISRVYTKIKKYTPVLNISLDKTELNLKKDQKFKLIPIITPYNATNDKVEWASDREDIAKVSPDGTVTALNIGEAIIKATSVEGKIEAECKVIVGVDSSLVSLIPNKESIIKPNSEIRIKFDYKLKSYNSEKIHIVDENNIVIDKDISIDDDTLIIKPISVKDNGGKYITYISNDAITNIFNRNLKEAIEFEYILEPNRVNTIKFKDKVLEDNIKKQLQVVNRSLSTDDMKKLIQLTVNDDIYSLEGIQYAVNLKKLNITKSNIISLKPISKLYLLEELSIGSSKIKEINFIENLTKLNSLTLKDANIKDISSIRNLSDLKYLDLSGNQIRKINYIDRLYSLEYLDLHNNFIENIFNLEKLSKIKVCNLDSNLISNIYSVKSMISKMDEKDRNNVQLNLENNLINYKSNMFHERAYKWLKDNVTSCKNLSDKIHYNKAILMSYNKVIEDKKYLIRNNEAIILEFAKEIEVVNNELITLTNEANENIDIEVLSDYNKLIINPKSNYKLGSSYKLNLNKGAINSLIVNEPNGFNRYEEYSKYKRIPFYEKSFDFELVANIQGDTNKDGKIDIMELANIAQAYGQEVDSTENWNANIDINEDGLIDLYDISYVAKLIK